MQPQQVLGAGRGTRGSWISAVEVWGALLAIAAASVVVSWWMGRDLNWDFFNYHAYAAHQVLGGGDGDFFAAGYQGYLNPAPFLPFALMDAAGWHSLAIGSALAALHSLNLFFLYLISREISVSSDRPRSTAVAITLLGAASAPFLCQVGSTFADVTTTVPVMAALWLTVARAGLGAGALAVALGAASVALKWTNAPYALALLLTQALILSNAPWRERLNRWVALLGASAAAFVLFYAPWGLKLWHEHGSPVFPLFNQILRSPDASTESIALDRFVPQTLQELISLPWRMMAIEGWIYAEPPSPDLRPMLLIALVMLCLVFRGWLAAMPGRVESTGVRDRERLRRLALPTFFVVSLVGWLATSTNGRYAIPLLLLLGPFIFRAASTLLPGSFPRIVVLVLALLQAMHMASAGNPRWSPQPWADRWLPAQVPASVGAEPALYVLVGRSSESYLAKHVHPDSVFTNPIGLISIPTGGPGWDRFAELRDSHRGSTKVVFGANDSMDPTTRRQVIEVHNDLIDRLGLQLVPSRCKAARFNDTSPQRQPGEPVVGRSGRRGVLICDAEPKPAQDALLAERRAKATRIMDAFESVCPRYFSPRGVPTEGSRDLWTRLYGQFDLYLMIDWLNGDILFRQERQATPVRIGTLETWESDVRQFRCRRPHDGSRGVSTIAGEMSSQ